MWWIPSEDEWYKAAYYDPTLNGTGGYWFYPTRSNTAPGNDYLTRSVANQANIMNADGDYSVTQSATVSTTQVLLSPVGSFINSYSAYGTYDQGGDVYQWNEFSNGTARGVRGGSWQTTSSAVVSTARATRQPTNGNPAVGFRVGTNPALNPLGRFTLVLTSTDSSDTVPQGPGYASLTAGTQGSAALAGRLPDGEIFGFIGVIVSGSTGNQIVVHKVLNYPSVTTKGAKGLLAGTITFATVSGSSDLSGTLEWMKPEQNKGDYPAAIDTNLNVTGSVYRFAAGKSVLPGFTSGTLELSDTGALSVSGSTELVKDVTLKSNNTITVTNPGTDALKMTITPTNGVFKGTFLYPGQTKRTSFNGVLYQDQTYGEGLFLGPNGSGSVILTGS